LINDSANMTSPRFPSLGIFPQARLSLAIGVLLLIGASWIFAGIAGDVMTGDPITTTDVRIAYWFHSHATLPLTRAMLFITHIHGTAGILFLSLLAAIYLIRSKERYWLLALVIAVPGSMILNAALKHVFQRSRPAFDEPLLTLTTYSFPSGHAAGATAFYGMLAAYFVCAVKPWRGRIAIALSAVALVALMGLSRIYLGVHYLSDVLAGIAESIAWLALCLTAVAVLRQRQAMQPLGN
jgi:undecaprenyl-diphosphatase